VKEKKKKVSYEKGILEKSEAKMGKQKALSEKRSGRSQTGKKTLPLLLLRMGKGGGLD